jgi:hypothetical protein
MIFGATNISKIAPQHRNLFGNFLNKTELSNFQGGDYEDYCRVGCDAG